MSVRQLAALRGRGTVYVHLDQTPLLRQAGIARHEGHGPVLIQALAELLGHADIRLQPVLDLDAPARVDRYEHPETLKDHTWLLAGGDVFPWPPRTATRDTVDFDHPTPYTAPAHRGRPAPTTPDRCAGDTTAGRPTAATAPARPGPAATSGRPPTAPATSSTPPAPTPCTPEAAEIILTAPPGVDIYLADIDLRDYA